MQRLGPRAYLVMEKKIFKGFTIYGHGCHFDQWTIPISAISHSPAHGGSAWNLSNTGPEASEEKPFEIINIFSIQMYGAHTNAYRSKLDFTVTRAGVCKTLCPQLPDSNTVWLQHCLAMMVTTVQIYDFNVTLSKGNNSKIGDDWNKKKIRVTDFWVC